MIDLIDDHYYLHQYEWFEFRTFSFLVLYSVRSVDFVRIVILWRNSNPIVSNDVADEANLFRFHINLNDCQLNRAQSKMKLYD